jgi:serine/threonine protein phosphatase PrpC
MDPWRVRGRVEKVEPEDTFLLCTGGVHGVFYDHQIEPPLRSPGGLRSAKDPEGRIALPDLQCRWLLDRAKQRGAPDNATLVVVRFKKGRRGRWPTRTGDPGASSTPGPPGPLPPAAVARAARRSARDDDDDDGA